MARTVAGLFDSDRTADLVVEHLVQEYRVPRERAEYEKRMVARLNLSID